ncbi:MAG: glycosyltransferase family 4 protein [Bryobacteraceae bacterium]
MKALFLAPESPYPLAGGGALRAASLLEYIAKGHDVDAVVFREPGRDDPRTKFPAALVGEVHVIDLPHHSRHGWSRVARNLGRLARNVPPLVDRFAGFDGAIERFLRGRRYDLAVVEHFWCATYIDLIARHTNRVVLDLHNVESAWHGSHAQATQGARSLAYRRFERASLALELALLPRFSLLLAASEEDAGRIRSRVPAAQVAVYPNSIPLVAQPGVPEDDAIAFSGTLDYDPNQDAILWFRRRVWPALRERWPGLRWRLVGRNADCVRRLISGDDRIECTGPVNDAVTELARAKVAVVPVRAGSGTRLKIVEAWAAARPVVSTALGAEGLPAQAGYNILIADDPKAFADAVSELLGSVSLRERLGGAGRAIYEQELSWVAAWTQLDQILHSVQATAAPTAG